MFNTEDCTRQGRSHGTVPATHKWRDAVGTRSGAVCGRPDNGGTLSLSRNGRSMVCLCRARILTLTRGACDEGDTLAAVHSRHAAVAAAARLDAVCRGRLGGSQVGVPPSPMIFMPSRASPPADRSSTPPADGSRSTSSGTIGCRGGAACWRRSGPMAAGPASGRGVAEPGVGPRPPGWPVPAPVAAGEFIGPWAGFRTAWRSRS